MKISVDKLSESDVREIVGDSFNQMNARQKNILLNPQNLSMWYELNKQDKVTLFRSATELMRKFWEKRRLQLEMLGISIDEINQVLDCLVNWLEKNGKISAPARVVSHCSGIAVKAFKSLGIIQEQNHQITFCHQSYLDYLIAERLLNNMDNDESIITWLGPKEKQTLFRREQLRQALTLLAEESPRRLLGTVKEIISSDNIRFHLKHLILELLGQMEEDSPVVDFIISLLNDEYWRPHLLETVFNGNIYLIRRLISNGILSNWLNSGDDRIINQGLGLLQSISNKMPDGAAEILESFIDKDGDWPNKILRTICWKITDDSDRMFELRLNLIRRGVILNFIDWESLCEKYPLRSLKLIEAILSTKNPEMIKDNYLGYKSPEYEILDTKELVSLYSVAQTYPEETWECLMPYIERLTFPKMLKIIGLCGNGIG